jgi:hypothetical protein
MTLVGATGGGITPDYFGVNAYIYSGENQYTFRSFGGRITPQPDRFKDDPKSYYGYRTNMQFWQANADATYKSQAKADINEGEAVYFSQVDAGGYGWAAVTTDKIRVSSERIQDNDDNEVTVKSLHGLVGFQSTEQSSPSVDTNMPVMAIYIEFENDNNQTPLEFLEVTGRHRSATVGPYDWSPMDANETASAWVGKTQLLDNHNRIIHETRGGMTIPMYNSVTRSI